MKFSYEDTKRKRKRMKIMMITCVSLIFIGAAIFVSFRFYEGNMFMHDYESSFVEGTNNKVLKEDFKKGDFKRLESYYYHSMRQKKIQNKWQNLNQIYFNRLSFNKGITRITDQKHPNYYQKNVTRAELLKLRKLAVKTSNTTDREDRLTKVDQWIVKFDKTQKNIEELNSLLNKTDSAKRIATSPDSKAQLVYYYTLANEIYVYDLKKSYINRIDELVGKVKKEISDNQKSEKAAHALTLKQIKADVFKTNPYKKAVLHTHRIQKGDAISNWLIHLKVDVPNILVCDKQNLYLYSHTDKDGSTIYTKKNTYTITNTSGSVPQNRTYPVTNIVSNSRYKSSLLTFGGSRHQDTWMVGIGDSQWTALQNTDSDEKNQAMINQCDLLITLSQSNLAELSQYIHKNGSLPLAIKEENADE
ncbi:hypothetical protein EFL77_08410 [Pediococcus pentosaceus]|nr:hypothetical protein [Pediococcus pentosaceus]